VTAARRDETRRDEARDDAKRRASSGRRVTNQVTGRVGSGRRSQSSTNLQDLAPAEAELVLGGRREVVLRYRLHILSSETTESTGNDVPLLLERARGRSLLRCSVPWRDEERSATSRREGVHFRKEEEGARGEGRRNGGGWKRKQEKEERCSLFGRARTPDDSYLFYECYREKATRNSLE